MTIRCPGCNNTVGERTADVVTIRHRGRTLVMRGQLMAVRCERCGREWIEEAPRTPNPVLKGAG